MGHFSNEINRMAVDTNIEARSPETPSNRLCRNRRLKKKTKEWKMLLRSGEGKKHSVHLLIIIRSMACSVGLHKPKSAIYCMRVSRKLVENCFPLVVGGCVKRKMSRICSSRCRTKNENQHSARKSNDLEPTQPRCPFVESIHAQWARSEATSSLDNEAKKRNDEKLLKGRGESRRF